jgi:ribonuclease R
MSQPPFTPSALEQAERLVRQPQHWEDRPQVQGITIDGPTSRDLDDAIWLEATAQGAILSVHIADVSDVIPLGSALDREAIARVHTRYYKTSNSPMLPRNLSEAALSLQAGQPRATLTIRLALSPTAEVQSCQLFESWLVSQQRFDYAQADTAISDPGSTWQPLLQACQDWAQRLNQCRRAAGALGGMETTGGFYLDEGGRLSVRPRYRSEQIIAEFMIAANTAAARWLAAADALALYRNHTAKAIAPGQDAMLQALLILGSAAAIRERLQNWLNRAEYSPSLVGHFALNVAAYGHFTSPIRRLADFINHRIIKAKLREQEPPYTKLDLENLSSHINQSVIEDKDRAHIYYRAQAQATLQNQIQSEDDFAQLAPKAFSRLLKHAVPNVPLTLAENVRSRLSQSQLQVVDYYLLLFHSQNLDLQHLILEHLETEVHQAASVLAIAQEAWQSMTYEEQQLGDRFLAWVVVVNGDQTQTTMEPGQASRKQAARHWACWLWLHCFIQGALVTPEHRQLPLMDEHKAMGAQGDQNSQRLQALLAQPQVEGQNHVGLLITVCQVMNWPEPVFEFEAWEQGFTAVCRLKGLGQVFEESAIAPKKKLAKQRSAMAVLERVRATQGSV